MLIIEIKVVPCAGKSGLTLTRDGKLKCFLKSSPEKGRANAELLALLARTLEIPIASVEIMSGYTVRTKRIKIDAPVSIEDIYKRFHIDAQQNFLKK